jgi:DNA repair ATPase RecN
LSGYWVDTGLLVGAVENIDAAVDQLEAARDVLNSVNQRLQSSATMSQETEADDRIDDFRDRWQEELELLGQMLSGFKEAVTAAAEVYAATDAEWAAGISGATSPATGAGSPPA